MIHISRENIVEYLSSLGFRNSKIISIRNVRNFCAKVETNEGCIIIKQQGGNSSTFANVSIRREILFYELTSQGLLSELKYLSPLLHKVDLTNSVILIEYLDQYDTFDLESNFNNFLISEKLGGHLAILHNQPINVCSKHFEKIDTANYFRSFDTITPESVNSGGILFAKCIELMQRYPDLNESIENFRNEFSWDCFVHGDLKLDNILFKNCDNDKIDIKFIDWELVGIGDRYLDLGYVIGSYILWWIEKKKFSEVSKSENDNRMLALKDHIYYFIVNYQEHLSEKIALDYVKLTRFSGIFLLSVFYSKSLFQTKYSKQDIVTLDIARKMLVTPKDVYPELFMKIIMTNYEKHF